MNPTSQTTPSEFKEPCFHVPGSRTIIDTAELDSDGVYRSTIKKETLAQVRIRYPDAEIGEWDNIYRAAENSCKTEPQEITEAQYIYALEVLPPVCWKTAKGVESFKISERLYGNVTAIYARLGKRYFTFSDLIFLTPDEIADRIAGSAAFNRTPVKFMTLEEFRSLNPGFHRSDKDLERDFDILTARVKKLNERQGPRIGDFVIFPDGSELRFTYDWSDVGGGIQTTSPTVKDASFYLSQSGLCDYSGALDDPLLSNELEETDEQRLGAVWFFSNDHAKAHNAVRAKIPFRVYRYKPASQESKTMTTGKQTTAPIVTACPQCGAELLNAIVRLSLYGVTVQDGLVVDYDGGPQPESEADIIELSGPDNTIIFCEAGHTIGASGPQPDPLQVLERIAHWPANSNSEPDVMGKALDEITTLAGEALRNLLPKQALRFKEGHGYNSTQTGDYYIFAGYSNGLYTFYRPFSGNSHRLTEEEAAVCFDHNHSKGKADRSEAQEASDWHNSDVTI